MKLKYGDWKFREGGREEPYKYPQLNSVVHPLQGFLTLLSHERRAKPQVALSSAHPQ